MTEVPGRDLFEQDLSMSEIYERLSERPAPDTLVQAQLRAEEFGAAAAAARNAGEREAAPIGPDQAPLSRRQISGKPQHAEAENVAESQEALRLYDCQTIDNHDEWFNCTFCAHNQLADWDYTWMWSTGSGSYSKNDVNRSIDNLWLYSGASLYHRVRWRYWYDWSYPVDINLPNWHYVTFFQQDWGTDFDVSSITNQADGDGYHWCAYGI
jgi:hypothetical protein